MQQLSPVLFTEHPAEEFILLQSNQQHQASGLPNDIPPANQSNNSKIIQYFHIRKFMQSLLKKKNYLAKLSMHHFNLINDLASSFNKKILLSNDTSSKPINFQNSAKRISWLGRLSKIFERIINHVPLVHPDGKLKIIWDSILVLPRLYFLFLIPVDLAWTNEQILYGYAIIPTLISLVLIIIDFFFGFACCYHIHGEVICDRKKVIMHNLTKSFGFEFASTILLVAFLIQQVQYDHVVDISKDIYYLLQLCFIVQYHNIAKIRDKLENTLNLSKFGSSLFEFIKLLCFICYLIHIFGCLWYWVGYYGSQQDVGWLINLQLSQSNFGNQYLRAIYFSAVTLFTVGYGDITPNSQPEFIVTIIFVIVSSMQLAYSINTVGDVLENIKVLREIKKNQAKKILKINKFMSKQQISSNLQIQVRQYMNENWRKKYEEETDSLIIDQLSWSLKEQITFEVNQRILNKCRLISDNFSDKIQGKLIEKLTTVELEPQATIEFYRFQKRNQKHNENEYQCLYFIEKGSVESFFVYQNNIVASKVATYAQGSCFNEIAFLTGTNVMEKFKTVEQTKLLILTRKDFISVLQDFPTEYEKFQQLLENYNIGKQIYQLGINCQSCQSRNHLTNDCPIIHFVPDKEVIVKRAVQTLNQNRQIHPRKSNRNRKVRTLEFQNIVSQSVKQMQIELAYDPEFCNIYDISDKQEQKKDSHISSFEFESSHKNTNVPFITLSGFIRDLELRQKLIVTKTELVKKCILDDLLLGKQMLIKLSENVEDQFETIRDFLGYKPNDNIDQLLFRLELYYQKLEPNEFDYFQKVRSQLGKYMLHPNNYILKYKYPQSLISNLKTLVNENQIYKKEKQNKKFPKRSVCLYMN